MTSAHAKPRLTRRGRSIRRRVFVTALILLVMGVAIGSTTAAFSANTSNANNTIATGTVAVGDNDGGSSPVVTLANARPGDTSTGCIKITYTGSLSSSMRLYANVTGTGLAQYIDLKITRGGSTADPFGSCTNFNSVADSTDYIGQGPGVIYNGTLSAFPSTYSAGLIDPISGTPESWSQNEAHTYKVQVTLQAGAPNAAQALTANPTFVWEARNE
jgi:predicted ribosomally synthesized peptide with SipW-like signal peptide